MTSFSTGTGGTIGGPPTPLPNEQEATAATQAQRMVLGLVADSLDRSLAHIDYSTTWKYSSNASNPSIPPLRQLRIAMSTRVNVPGWTAEQEYDRLRDTLPEEIRARLAEEQQLPLDQRSEVFKNLELFLRAASEMNVWSNASSQSIDVEAIPFTHIPQYQALIPLARQEFALQSTLMLNTMKDFLNATGHNDPFFDVRSRFVSQTENVLNEFAEAGNDQHKLESLSVDIGILKSQLNNNNLGGDLQVLNHLVDTLSIVAGASTVNPGVAPLFFGLYSASIGATNSNVIPEGVTQFSQFLVNEMRNSGLLSNASSGNLQLLPLLLSAAFTGSMTWSSMTAENESMGGSFGLANSLQYALQTGFFDAVFSSILNANGADPKAKDLANLANLLFIIQSVEKTFAETIAECTRDMLDKWLDNIQEIADKAKRDREKELPILREISFKITQARIALQQENYNAFLESIADFGRLLNAGNGLSSLLGKTISTTIAGTSDVITPNTGSINI